MRSFTNKLSRGEYLRIAKGRNNEPRSIILSEERNEVNDGKKVVGVGEAEMKITGCIVKMLEAVKG